MQPHYGMQPPGGVMQPHGGMAPPPGGSVPYSGGWNPAATYGAVHAPQHHQHPPMGYPPDLYHAHHLQQYHHSMAPPVPRAGTGLGSSPFLPPPASSGAPFSIPLSAASGIALPREGSVGFSTASAAPTYRHLFPSSQRPAQGFGGSRTMHAEDPRAAHRSRTSSARSSDPSPPLSSDSGRPTGSSVSRPSGTSGVQSANRKNDDRRSATGGDTSSDGSRQPASAREPSSGNSAQAGQKPSTRPKMSTGSKRTRTWDEHQKDLVVLARSLTVKAEYHTLSNSHGARVGTLGQTVLHLVNDPPSTNFRRYEDLLRHHAQSVSQREMPREVHATPVPPPPPPENHTTPKDGLSIAFRPEQEEAGGSPDDRLANLLARTSDPLPQADLPAYVDAAVDTWMFPTQPDGQDRQIQVFDRTPTVYELLCYWSPTIADPNDETQRSGTTRIIAFRRAVMHLVASELQRRGAAPFRHWTNEHPWSSTGLMKWFEGLRWYRIAIGCLCEDAVLTPDMKEDITPVSLVQRILLDITRVLTPHGCDAWRTTYPTAAFREWLTARLHAHVMWCYFILSGCPLTSAHRAAWFTDTEPTSPAGAEALLNARFVSTTLQALVPAAAIGQFSTDASIAGASATDEATAEAARLFTSMYANARGVHISILSVQLSPCRSLVPLTYTGGVISYAAAGGAEGGGEEDLPAGAPEPEAPPDGVAPTAAPPASEERAPSAEPEAQPAPAATEPDTQSDNVPDAAGNAHQPLPSKTTLKVTLSEYFKRSLDAPPVIEFGRGASGIIILKIAPELTLAAYHMLGWQQGVRPEHGNGAYADYASYHPTGAPLSTAGLLSGPMGRIGTTLYHLLDGEGNPGPVLDSLASVAAVSGPLGTFKRKNDNTLVHGCHPDWDFGQALLRPHMPYPLQCRIGEALKAKLRMGIYFNRPPFLWSKTEGHDEVGVLPRELAIILEPPRSPLPLGVKGQDDFLLPLYDHGAHGPDAVWYPISADGQVPISERFTFLLCRKLEGKYYAASVLPTTAWIYPVQSPNCPDALRWDSTTIERIVFTVADMSNRVNPRALPLLTSFVAVGREERFVDRHQRQFGSVMLLFSTDAVYLSRTHIFPDSSTLGLVDHGAPFAQLLSFISKLPHEVSRGGLVLLPPPSANLSDWFTSGYIVAASADRNPLRNQLVVRGLDPVPLSPLDAILQLNLRVAVDLTYDGRAGNGPCIERFSAQPVLLNSLAVAEYLAAGLVREALPHIMDADMLVLRTGCATLDEVDFLCTLSHVAVALNPLDCRPRPLDQQVVILAAQYARLLRSIAKRYVHPHFTAAPLHGATRQSAPPQLRATAFSVPPNRIQLILDQLRYNERILSTIVQRATDQLVSVNLLFAAPYDVRIDHGSNQYQIRPEPGNFVSDGNSSIFDYEPFSQGNQHACMLRLDLPQGMSYTSMICLTHVGILPCDSFTAPHYGFLLIFVQTVLRSHTGNALQEMVNHCKAVPPRPHLATLERSSGYRWPGAGDYLAPAPEVLKFQQHVEGTLDAGFHAAMHCFVEQEQQRSASMGEMVRLYLLYHLGPIFVILLMSSRDPEADYQERWSFLEDARYLQYASSDAQYHPNSHQQYRAFDFATKHPHVADLAHQLTEAIKRRSDYPQHAQPREMLLAMREVLGRECTGPVNCLEKYCARILYVQLTCRRMSVAGAALPAVSDLLTLPPCLGPANIIIVPPSVMAGYYTLSVPNIAVSVRTGNLLVAETTAKELIVRHHNSSVFNPFSNHFDPLSTANPALACDPSAVRQHIKLLEVKPLLTEARNREAHVNLEAAATARMEQYQIDAIDGGSVQRDRSAALPGGSTDRRRDGRDASSGAPFAAAAGTGAPSVAADASTRAPSAAAAATSATDAMEEASDAASELRSDDDMEPEDGEIVGEASFPEAQSNHNTTRHNVAARMGARFGAPQERHPSSAPPQRPPVPQFSPTGNRSASRSSGRQQSSGRRQSSKGQQSSGRQQSSGGRQPSGPQQPSERRPRENPVTERGRGRGSTPSREPPRPARGPHAPHGSDGTSGATEAPTAAGIADIVHVEGDVIECGGGGDCLFLSARAALDPEQYTPFTLRQAVCEMIATNWQWSDDVEWRNNRLNLAPSAITQMNLNAADQEGLLQRLRSGISDDSFVKEFMTSYVDTMSRPGEYGGPTELLALAMIAMDVGYSCIEVWVDVPGVVSASGKSVYMLRARIPDRAGALSGLVSKAITLWHNDNYSDEGGHYRQFRRRSGRLDVQQFRDATLEDRRKEEGRIWIATAKEVLATLPDGSGEAPPNDGYDWLWAALTSYGTFHQSDAELLGSRRYILLNWVLFSLQDLARNGAFAEVLKRREQQQLEACEVSQPPSERVAHLELFCLLPPRLPEQSAKVGPSGGEYIHLPLIATYLNARLLVIQSDALSTVPKCTDRDSELGIYSAYQPCPRFRLFKPGEVYDEHPSLQTVLCMLRETYDGQTGGALLLLGCSSDGKYVAYPCRGFMSDTFRELVRSTAKLQGSAVSDNLNKQAQQANVAENSLEELRSREWQPTVSELLSMEGASLTSSPSVSHGASPAPARSNNSELQVPDPEDTAFNLPSAADLDLPSAADIDEQTAIPNLVTRRTVTHVPDVSYIGENPRQLFHNALTDPGARVRTNALQYMPQYSGWPGVHPRCKLTVKWRVSAKNSDNPPTTDIRYKLECHPDPAVKFRDPSAYEDLLFNLNEYSHGHFSLSASAVLKAQMHSVTVYSAYVVPETRHTPSGRADPMTAAAVYKKDYPKGPQLSQLVPVQYTWPLANNTEEKPSFSEASSIDTLCLVLVDGTLKGCRLLGPGLKAGHFMVASTNLNPDANVSRRDNVTLLLKYDSVPAQPMEVSVMHLIPLAQAVRCRFTHGQQLRSSADSRTESIPGRAPAEMPRLDDRINNGCRSLIQWPWRYHGTRVPAERMYVKLHSRAFEELVNPDSFLLPFLIEQTTTIMFQFYRYRASTNTFEVDVYGAVLRPTFHLHGRVNNQAAIREQEKAGCVQIDKTRFRLTAEHVALLGWRAPLTTDEWPHYEEQWPRGIHQGGHVGYPRHLVPDAVHAVLACLIGVELTHQRWLPVEYVIVRTHYAGDIYYSITNMPIIAHGFHCKYGGPIEVRCEEFVRLGFYAGIPLRDCCNLPPDLQPAGILARIRHVIFFPEDQASTFAGRAGDPVRGVFVDVGARYLATHQRSITEEVSRGLFYLPASCDGAPVPLSQRLPFSDYRHRWDAQPPLHPAIEYYWDARRSGVIHWQLNVEPSPYPPCFSPFPVQGAASLLVGGGENRGLFRWTAEGTALSCARATITRAVYRWHERRRAARSHNLHITNNFDIAVTPGAEATDDLAKTPLDAICRPLQRVGDSDLTVTSSTVRPATLSASELVTPEALSERVSILSLDELPVPGIGTVVKPVEATPANDPSIEELVRLGLFGLMLRAHYQVPPAVVTGYADYVPFVGSPHSLCLTPSCDVGVSDAVHRIFGRAVQQVIRVLNPPAKWESFRKGARRLLQFIRLRRMVLVLRLGSAPHRSLYSDDSCVRFVQNWCAREGYSSSVCRLNTMVDNGLVSVSKIALTLTHPSIKNYSGVSKYPLCFEVRLDLDQSTILPLTAYASEQEIRFERQQFPPRQPIRVSELSQPEMALERAAALLMATYRDTMLAPSTPSPLGSAPPPSPPASPPSSPHRPVSTHGLSANGSDRGPGTIPVLDRLTSSLVRSLYASVPSLMSPGASFSGGPAHISWEVHDAQDSYQPGDVVLEKYSTPDGFDNIFVEKRIIGRDIPQLVEVTINGLRVGMTEEYWTSFEPIRHVKRHHAALTIQAWYRYHGFPYRHPQPITSTGQFEELRALVLRDDGTFPPVDLLRDVAYEMGRKRPQTSSLRALYHVAYRQCHPSRHSSDAEARNYRDIPGLIGTGPRARRNIPERTFRNYRRLWERFEAVLRSQAAEALASLTSPVGSESFHPAPQTEHQPFPITIPDDDGAVYPAGDCVTQPPSPPPSPPPTNLPAAGLATLPGLSIEENSPATVDTGASSSASRLDATRSDDGSDWLSPDGQQRLLHGSPTGLDLNEQFRQMVRINRVKAPPKSDEKSHGPRSEPYSDSIPLIFEQGFDLIAEVWHPLWASHIGSEFQYLYRLEHQRKKMFDGRYETLAATRLFLALRRFVRRRRERGLQAVVDELSCLPTLSMAPQHLAVQPVCSLDMARAETARLVEAGLITPSPPVLASREHSNLGTPTVSNYRLQRLQCNQDRPDFHDGTLVGHDAESSSSEPAPAVLSFEFTISDSMQPEPERKYYAIPDVGDVIAAQLPHSARSPDAIPYIMVSPDGQILVSDDPDQEPYHPLYITPQLGQAALPMPVYGTEDRQILAEETWHARPFHLLYEAPMRFPHRKPRVNTQMQYHLPVQGGPDTDLHFSVYEHAKSDMPNVLRPVRLFGVLIIFLPACNMDELDEIRSRIPSSQWVPGTSMVLADHSIVGAPGYAQIPLMRMLPVMTAAAGSYYALSQVRGRLPQPLVACWPDMSIGHFFEIPPSLSLQASLRREDHHELEFSLWTALQTLIQYLPPGENSAILQALEANIGAYISESREERWAQYPTIIEALNGHEPCDSSSILRKLSHVGASHKFDIEGGGQFSTPLFLVAKPNCATGGILTLSLYHQPPEEGILLCIPVDSVATLGLVQAVLSRCNTSPLSEDSRAKIEADLTILLPWVQRRVVSLSTPASTVTLSRLIRLSAERIQKAFVESAEHQLLHRGVASTLMPTLAQTPGWREEGGLVFTSMNALDLPVVLPSAPASSPAAAEPAPSPAPLTMAAVAAPPNVGAPAAAAPTPSVLGAVNMTIPSQPSGDEVPLRQEVMEAIQSSEVRQQDMMARNSAERRHDLRVLQSRMDTKQAEEANRIDGALQNLENTLGTQMKTLLETLQRSLKTGPETPVCQLKFSDQDVRADLSMGAQPAAAPAPPVQSNWGVAPSVGHLRPGPSKDQPQRTYGEIHKCGDAHDYVRPQSPPPARGRPNRQSDHGMIAIHEHPPQHLVWIMIRQARGMGSNSHILVAKAPTKAVISKLPYAVEATAVPDFSDEFFRRYLRQWFLGESQKSAQLPKADLDAAINSLTAQICIQNCAEGFPRYEQAAVRDRLPPRVHYFAQVDLPLRAELDPTAHEQHNTEVKLYDMLLHHVLRPPHMGEAVFQPFHFATSSAFIHEALETLQIAEHNLNGEEMAWVELARRMAMEHEKWLAKREYSTISRLTEPTERQRVEGYQLPQFLAATSVRDAHHLWKELDVQLPDRRPSESLRSYSARFISLIYAQSHRFLDIERNGRAELDTAHLRRSGPDPSVGHGSSVFTHLIRKFTSQDPHMRKTVDTYGVKRRFASRILQLMNEPRSANPCMDGTGSDCEIFMDALMRTILETRVFLDHQNSVSVVDMVANEQAHIYMTSRYEDETTGEWIERLVGQVRTPEEIYDRALRSSDESSNLQVCMQNFLIELSVKLQPMKAKKMAEDILKKFDIYTGREITLSDTRTPTAKKLASRITSVQEFADVMLFVRYWLEGNGHDVSTREEKPSAEPRRRRKSDLNATFAEPPDDGGQVADSPSLASGQSSVSAASPADSATEILAAVTAATEPLMTSFKDIFLAALKELSASLASVRSDLRETQAIIQENREVKDNKVPHSGQHVLHSREQPGGEACPTCNAPALQALAMYDYSNAMYAYGQQNRSYSPGRARPPWNGGNQMGRGAPSVTGNQMGRGAANAPRFPFDKDPTPWESLPADIIAELARRGITGPNDPKWLTKEGTCVACGGDHTARWCPALWAQTPAAAHYGDEYVRARAARLLWNKEAAAAMPIGAMMARLDMAVLDNEELLGAIDTMSHSPGFSTAVQAHPLLSMAYTGRHADAGRAFLANVEALSDPRSPGTHSTDHQ